VIADAKKLLLDGKALLSVAFQSILCTTVWLTSHLRSHHTPRCRPPMLTQRCRDANPRAHALFADKRNLTVLSSHTDNLKHWIARTISMFSAHRADDVIVSPDNVDAFARSPQSVLQADARHGSKRLSRDKVTRKCGRDHRGEYVAQSYAARHARVQLDETLAELKLRAPVHLR